MPSSCFQDISVPECYVYRPLVGITAAATAMLHLKLSRRDQKKYVHFSVTAGLTSANESKIIKDACTVAPVRTDIAMTGAVEVER
jgi:hypothetical protein